MNTVMIDGVDTPYKLTNRAKRSFEKRMKVTITDMDTSFDNLCNLALEAINEGVKISGTGSLMTIETLLDADAKAEVSIIDTVLQSMDDNQGKSKASTAEA